MQTQDFIVVWCNPTYIHSPQAPNRVRGSTNMASNLSLQALQWTMILINPFRLMAPSTFLHYGFKYPLEQDFSRESLQTLPFELWFQSTLIRYRNEERVFSLQFLLKCNITKKLGLNDALKWTTNLKANTL